MEVVVIHLLQRQNSPGLNERMDVEIEIKHLYVTEIIFEHHFSSDSYRYIQAIPVAAVRETAHHVKLTIL